MKRFLSTVALLFLCSGNLSAVTQLAPNDQRLAEDPIGYGEDSQRVSDYIVMSGLDRLAQQLDSDPKTIAGVLDKAVDAIVTTGLRTLREKGYTYQAGQLEIEYNQVAKGQLVHQYDLFDHAPWSQFLVKFYGALESMLGHNACVFMHFDDINEINYAITVVFDPKNPAYDINEYRKHFVPLCEGISYWVSYIACVAVTWGSGAIAMICTPIGDVVERVMTCCLSSKLSDRVYNRANGINP